MFKIDFFKWSKGTDLEYSTSIASSWIWSPAIFLSAYYAYYYGLAGFLMFFLPNLITLFLFGLVASYVRDRYEGYTVIDALQGSSWYQKRVHLIVYIVIIIFSTCTQLIGLQTILLPIFNSKVVISLVASVIVLSIVWGKGLKSSIISDYYKYFIMLICASVLLFKTEGSIDLKGTSGLTSLEMFKVFGFTTSLGLLTGVYSDMTLWQRVFSIPKERVKRCFFKAGLMFSIIPLIFGLIGFMNTGATGWDLSKQFNGGILNVVLVICVVSTLIATLDSNLCSIASIPCMVMGKELRYGRLVMVSVLVVGCLVTSIDLFNLSSIFLTYNTVRACIAIPCLLIIFNKYDSIRLLIGTVISVLVAPLGYYFTSSWIFTLLGFLIPLLGIKLDGIEDFLIKLLGGVSKEEHLKVSNENVTLTGKYNKALKDYKDLQSNFVECNIRCLKLENENKSLKSEFDKYIK